MINLSMPFLAKKLDQAVKIEDCQGFEATIFNREDLEDETWTLVWKNIEWLKKACPNKTITFHFPVNDSDYGQDLFVRNRVKEALSRASDVGLAGVVVHSNRIRPIPDWQAVNLEEDRKIVVEALNELTASSSCLSTWLALENMPVMDNYGKEIDPLFCYPNDFLILDGTNIGIVWDSCHFTSTISNINQVILNIQKTEHYPNIQKSSYLDFLQLDNRIKHWHFSGFKGIADPDTGSTCKEGTLPYESELSEDVYLEILRTISLLDNSKRVMVLEIQEQDYLNRMNFQKTVKWIRKNEL